MEETTEQNLTETEWRARVLSGHIQNIGPLWTRMTDGVWHFGLLIEDKHLNPAGLVHGGALLSLLDHVVSVVAWEAAARQPCVTVQLDAQFRSAARRGDFVTAAASVAKQTRELLKSSLASCASPSGVTTSCVMSGMMVASDRMCPCKSKMPGSSLPTGP